MKTAGLAEAKFELGKLYLAGLGVNKSERKAKKWLKRAAKQGYQPAIDLLAELEAWEN